MTSRSRALGALVLVALGAAGFAGWRLWGTPADAQQAPPDAAIAVVLAAAQTRDVPVWRDGLGTVQAFQTVTVRARVDGQIDKIAFTEGGDVKRGDLLAQIDARPFQAALEQAQAQKARDEALLSNARLDFQRYNELSRDRFASRQQVDTQRATVAQAEASVQADQASIDNATTQLDYTRITAPIAGRLGARQIDQGNLVRATESTGIVVITQLDPIALFFTLPQDDLADVIRRQQEAMRSDRPGFAPPEGVNEPPANGLRMQALARDGKVLAEGRLLFADNQINETSGTVRLKAAFPNPDNALWPGQAVAARLLVETRRNAVTVPLAAMQRGQDGPFAYALKQDGTVEIRKLRIGPSTEGYVVVEDGVAAGEQVVTDGFYRLKPGARVKASQPPGSGGTTSAAPRKDAVA